MQVTYPPLPFAPLLWVLCAVVLGQVAWRAAHGPEVWESAPAREVSTTVRVVKVFSGGVPGQYGYAGGLAQVLKAPAHLHYLNGQRVALRVKIPAVNHTDVNANAAFLNISNTSNTLKNNPPHALVLGDVMNLTGILQPVQAEGYAFGRYLRQQGVLWEVRRARGVWKGSSPWQQWLAGLRERGWVMLHTGLPENATSSLYSALLMGQKQWIDTPLKNKLALSGTLHLFAISGLHVGLVAGVLWAALRYMPLAFFMPARVRGAWNAWGQAIFGLSLLFIFVQFTGAAPSAMRAWALAALVWLGSAFGRRPQAWALLIATAVLALALGPQQLWSAGFQLSYLAVAGIVWFGAGFAHSAQGVLNMYILNDNDDEDAANTTNTTKASNQTKRTIMRTACVWLAGSVAVGMGASLGAALPSLAHFGNFAPLGVVWTLLLMPLVAAVLFLGLVALVLSSVWSGFAVVPNWVAYQLLSVFEQGVGFTVHAASQRVLLAGVQPYWPLGSVLFMLTCAGLWWAYKTYAPQRYLLQSAGWVCLWCAHWALYVMLSVPAPLNIPG